MDGTITFVTRSGSLYELDVCARRVRRIAGPHTPTARQGNDGDWRTYIDVPPVVYLDPDALGLFFDWTGHGNGTFTSPVSEDHVAAVVSALGF